MSKIKVSELKCFGQVSDIIGKARAEIELFKVVTNGECNFFNKEGVFDSFYWNKTIQGHMFWSDIHDGINPYDNRRV